MKFNNRKSAGTLLASILNEYKHDKNAVVLGIPHGGVVVAKRVAEVLGVPFDIIVSRKIRSSKNPEYAVGVVTEIGEALLDTTAVEIEGMTHDGLKDEIKKQQDNVASRLLKYRGVHKEVEIKGKTALIVDDGIATGWAMHGAILSAKQKNPKKIIIISPVASQESIDRLEPEVDEVIVAHVPLFFSSVGQFYLRFPQISEDKVMDIINDELN
jgi:predicted phosphoribosyltransferase